METTPWFVYLFYAVAGLFVLLVGGILVLAIVNAIRIAYTKHPSRFQRADRLDAFEREKLPELAQRLDLQMIDKVPSQVKAAIETTVGRLEFGCVSDMLARCYGEGTLSLCNVQKILSKSHNFRGEDSIEWTKVEEYTCLVFTGGNETAFPSFNLTPNEHSLMIKLFNRRMFGAVQYDDDPEFHRQILIGTTEPDDVRPLLTPHVRDVLKQNTDLRTAVYGPYIVVYDYGNIGKGIRFLHSRRDDGAIVDCEVISAECWPKFYEAALEVIESLRTAESQLSNQFSCHITSSQPRSVSSSKPPP